PRAADDRGARRLRGTADRPVARRRRAGAAARAAAADCAPLYRLVRTRIRAHSAPRALRPVRARGWLRSRISLHLDAPHERVPADAGNGGGLMHVHIVGIGGTFM